MSFTVTFRGVRGSIPTPEKEFRKYGGNTSCIEVLCGDQVLIFDSGTGIRKVGRRILAEDIKRVHVFFSHTHWDHIHAFPFFIPAYDKNRDIIVHAGHLGAHNGISHALSNQMAPPFFPVPIEILRGFKESIDFAAGDDFRFSPEIRIRTAPLNHPNGATGYRVDYKGKAFCYVTDTEHIIGKPDQAILDLIQGADLVAYDSTYTDEMFAGKINWGHSTWQEGVRLCRLAGAKSLAIFHHDPDHDDAIMDGIASQAKATWDETFVAREEETIVLVR